MCIRDSLYTYHLGSDGKFHSTASNATPEELAEGTYSKYWDEYEEPDLRTAWETNKALYGEVKDQFAHVYFLFQPFTTPDGTRYIAGADIAIESLYASLDASLRNSILIGIVSFLVMFAFSFYLGSRVSLKISQLADYTHELAATDFQPVQDLPLRQKIGQMPKQSRDEIAQLASSFIAMETRLNNYLRELTETTAHKERLRNELRIAGDIQLSMLPSRFAELVRDDGRLRLDLHAAVKPTKEAGGETSPIWSPDSRRIAYNASRTGGQSSIYWRAADGSGEEEQLTTGPNLRVPFSWSRDGQTLFFVEQNPQNSNDIWALPMTGDRTTRALVTSRFDERRPAISPDGRWLAYGTNEQGPPEIHVRPYPETAREKYQASAGGGTSPVWSIDGRAIFYRNGGKYFRVNVTTSPDFKAGKPEELFTLIGSDQTMNYDLAPDGKRFAVIKSGSDGSGVEYRVVVNWIEELRARVRPAK